MATELIGQRMTSQRKLLLKIIRDAGGHLDADELFQKAKERDPRISLSTIYRNLNLLKELDLIAERHFVEDHHHYELKDTTEHHHLVCRSCGEVFEFDSLLTLQMKQDEEDTSQFQVTDIEINMQGYCLNCQKDMP